MHKLGLPNVDVFGHECYGVNVRCDHNRSDCYKCYNRNILQQDNYDNKTY